MILTVEAAESMLDDLRSARDLIVNIAISAPDCDMLRAFAATDANEDIVELEGAISDYYMGVTDPVVVNGNPAQFVADARADYAELQNCALYAALNDEDDEPISSPSYSDPSGADTDVPSGGSDADADVDYDFTGTNPTEVRSSGRGALVAAGAAGVIAGLIFLLR